MAHIIRIVIQNKMEKEDVENGSTSESKEWTPIQKSDAQKLSLKDKLKIFLLCLNQLVVNMSFAMLITFYPNVAYKKGINEIQLGYIFSIYHVGSLLSVPFIAYGISIKGTATVLNFCLFLEAITEICFSFTNNVENPSIYLAVCLVLRLLQGISVVGVQTITFSIITNEFEDKAGTLTGLLEMSNGIAFSLSSFCGGVLFEYVGFKAPFIVLFVLTTIVLALNCIFSTGNSRYEVSNKPFGQSLRLLKFPSIYAGIISTFLILLQQSFMASNFSPFCMKSYGIGEAFVGFLLGTNTIIYLMLLIPIGYLIDYTGVTRPFLFIGLLIRGTGYLFIAPETILRLKPSISYGIIGQIVIGVGYVFCFVPIFKYLITIVKKFGINMDFDTSAVLATLVNIAQSSGSIVGPVLGGVLEEYTSFSFVGNIFAVLIMISALLILL